MPDPGWAADNSPRGVSGDALMADMTVLPLVRLRLVGQG